jgi:stress-induced morphogen
MAQVNRAKKEDCYSARIQEAFGPYREKHPRAIIDAYRYNPACVRVRVIDPDFQGLDRIERDNLIWKVLETLPDDVQSEISMLVLVTPRERKKSGSNLEFEDPTPSRF